MGFEKNPVLFRRIPKIILKIKNFTKKITHALSKNVQISIIIASLHFTSVLGKLSKNNTSIIFFFIYMCYFLYFRYVNMSKQFFFLIKSYWPEQLKLICIYLNKNITQNTCTYYLKIFFLNIITPFRGEMFFFS